MMVKIFGNKATDGHNDVYNNLGDTFTNEGGMVISTIDIVSVVICASIVFGVIGFLFLFFKNRRKCVVKNLSDSLRFSIKPCQSLFSP
jgi:hypothetical protein